MLPDHGAILLSHEPKQRGRLAQACDENDQLRGDHEQSVTPVVRHREVVRVQQKRSENESRALEEGTCQRVGTALSKQSPQQSLLFLIPDWFDPP